MLILSAGCAEKAPGLAWQPARHEHQSRLARSPRDLRRVCERGSRKPSGASMDVNRPMPAKRRQHWSLKCANIKSRADRVLSDEKQRLLRFENILAMSTEPSFRVTLLRLERALNRMNRLLQTLQLRTSTCVYEYIYIYILFTWVYIYI